MTRPTSTPPGKRKPTERFGLVPTVAVWRPLNKCPRTELHVHFDKLDHIDHACLELLMNWESSTRHRRQPGYRLGRPDRSFNGAALPGSSAAVGRFLSAADGLERLLRLVERGGMRSKSPTAKWPLGSAAPERDGG